MPQPLPPAAEAWTCVQAPASHELARLHRTLACRHSPPVVAHDISARRPPPAPAPQDKTVRLWDVRTNICQGCLTVPGQPTATIDQQGLVFAVATESGIVKLYDLRSYDKGPFDTFAVRERGRGGAACKRKPAHRKPVGGRLS